MTRIEAPAKLTLSLAITGVRNDGYHLIDAEMVALGLADDITLEESSTTRITVLGEFADGVPTDESNLVHKALSLVERTANVIIHKNIPHGGGLGGGSTNAAAVLRWAGCTDSAVAASIGADVPFTLHGGRARVTGIGEIVSSLPFVAHDITLFVPPVHVSTPLVYRTWDTMNGPKGDQGNDLEPAAIAAVPELAVWRDSIADAFGVRPRLAGSGATWFTEGHVAGTAPHGLVVVHTTTRPDAGRVVEEKE
jgi:4-diphosphocytidyl-2-C-methyl-D-erythritol kinase